MGASSAGIADGILLRASHTHRMCVRVRGCVGVDGVRKRRVTFGGRPRDYHWSVCASSISKTPLKKMMVQTTQPMNQKAVFIIKTSGATVKT